jgi:two-component system nitrogen regulation sensor histidine kinase NtrY
VFRRSPYIGWLALAVLMWGLVSYRHYRHKVWTRPASMAQTVSNDLTARETSFSALLNNKDLVERMFSGRLRADEVNQMSKSPFLLFGIHKGVLVYWNSNIVVTGCEPKSLLSGTSTLYVTNGTYLKKCISIPFPDGERFLVVLFPVSYNYPFENEYLRSHFAAASYIPPSTKVLDKHLAGAVAVKDTSGHPMFFLQFNPNDIPKWIPDSFMIAGILLALFITISWINLIAITLSRNKAPLRGLGVILGFILLFRIGTILFGLPFYLGELTLFTPRLYAASALLPSLGDLLINLLCLLWMVGFIVSNFPSQKLLWPPRKRTACFVEGLLIILLMVAFAYLPADIMHSLVMNSQIPFDVSHFNSINLYTLLGLFTIALVACSMSLTVYLLNVQVRLFIPGRPLRFISLIAFGLLGLFFREDGNHLYQYFAFGWLLLFVLLLEIPQLTKSSGLLASNMVFWAVFLALSSALALYYFNGTKEENNRRMAAERISEQRDPLLEYLFEGIAEKMSRDSVLRGFLNDPGADIRPVADEHLGTAYLKGQLNRYQPVIYLFRKNGTNVFNKDTTSLDHLFTIIAQAEPVNNYLYYRENAKDAHYYIAGIAIKNDSGALKGYMFIDLSLKLAGNEAVYPELLQPEKLKDLRSPIDYGYGIYVNRHLITQTPDFPFPEFLRGDTMRPGGVKAFKTDEGYVYRYKIDQDKTVVIRHMHNTLLESVTLFSYLLGIMMVFSLVTILLHLYFQYLLRKDPAERIIHLTFRKRIHFAMLAVVLVSFFIIGTVTILYFVDQYNDTNRDKLQSTMQTVEKSARQYLNDKNKAVDTASFYIESGSPTFHYFVSGLAKSQNCDINVYDAYGSLQATSQDDIYNKSLLARIMMPEAYYTLSELHKPFVIQDEHIGKLNYLSCYVPIRGENGNAVGYLNVPFFSSQKELNYQISNILVALINLFAIIFLLSSLMAVLITNWLTRTLQVVISRFEQVNLKKNELLEWPYDDEIGVLVREYNKMVKKVEENATLMAKNERESAWREMARQVAHEIKNPLTPMKLNIQYLQQALRNGHPNIQELISNVAESLIGQIDNLSHIASAFSSFATMPEAKPERVALNELLTKATEIYMNNDQVNVELISWAEPLIVNMDKSQLLRVFTNLMQNAVEAMPIDGKGTIIVQLQKEGTDALLSFSDDGDGIPEDIIDRIFSPYFTTKSSGTGLGLAMTKKIIEFWNGSIWFETKKGEGTTFFIRLPLDEG